jgi:hypothetical protein
MNFSSPSGNNYRNLGVFRDFDGVHFQLHGTNRIFQSINSYFCSRILNERICQYTRKSNGLQPTRFQK